jgi:hypothetical protein
MTAPATGAAREEKGSSPAPFGPWKTAPVLAALRHERITLLGVFDGPVNGAWFFAYTGRVLVQRLPPGDIVVRDNSPLA